jgi:hypothetical protein
MNLKMLSSNIGAISSWNLVYNMEQILLVLSFSLESRGERTLFIPVQIHFLCYVYQQRIGERRRKVY